MPIVLLIYFVPFTFPFQLGVSFRDCHSCNSIHFLAISSSCWLLLSIHDSSGYMCRFHIALQELEVFALMLHQMTFHLAGKVVALYLDDSL